MTQVAIFLENGFRPRKRIPFWLDGLALSGTLLLLVFFGVVHDLDSLSLILVALFDNFTILTLLWLLHDFGLMVIDARFFEFLNESIVVGRWRELPNVLGCVEEDWHFLLFASGIDVGTPMLTVARHILHRDF